MKNGRVATRDRKPVNVLHICSGYARHKLYNELVTNLATDPATSQFVYVPVRSREEIDGNRNDALLNTKFRYAHVLKKWHKVAFRQKIRTVYADVCSHVTPSYPDVAHAHFLFSDGAVALRLKQDSGIPYIAAVRNTDLNYFMRYRPDLWGLCQEILLGASAVIFLSPAYQMRLLDRLPPSLRQTIETKSRVIPNGLRRPWLTRPPPRQPVSTLRLLYVGDFSRNKNVENTIEAAQHLRLSRDVTLSLVGGGGNGAETIGKLLDSKQHDHIRFAGRITDTTELIHVFRQHDIFVMPSYAETFGVVYAEALSQGLPVIHSHGQGVAGYFAPDTVAQAVDPSDPLDIARGVEILADKLTTIRDTCIVEARQFDWRLIAERYRDLYRAAVEN